MTENMESVVSAAPSGTVSMEESAAAIKPRPKIQRPTGPTVSRISSARLSTENSSSSLKSENKMFSLKYKHETRFFL